jgi:hypothetical protein
MIPLYMSRRPVFCATLLACGILMAALGDWAKAAPATVTIVRRAAIETLSSNGDVNKVSEATTGTQYSFVGVQGSMVEIQDSTGTHYLVPVNCTDYLQPSTPPDAASTNTAPESAPPATVTNIAPESVPPAPATNIAPQPVAPVVSPSSEPAPTTSPDGSAGLILPGKPWLDNRGVLIQAHGGGIIQLGDTWYWFGEDYEKVNPQHLRYVGCYSSKDLLHWQFRNQVVKADDPAKLGKDWKLERPKVFYNAKTNKYVMYAHVDSSNYGAAKLGVFTCDTVDGDYQYLTSFRPFNDQSRDIGQFIDDDGSAYLIFEDRAKGMHIAKLSDDYLTLAKDVFLFPKNAGGGLEAGTLVHYNGLYYFVASRRSGWYANANQYATATSLEGPWSVFNGIAPQSKNTYGSQSTMLLKVVGSKTTTVIFMGDQWHQYSLWDSRYLWMPLQIGDGKLELPPPKPWTIDVKTGETTIDPAGQP